MYNIKVYTKDDKEIFVDFNSKYNYNLNETIIIIKSILWSYCYAIADNHNITFELILRSWFDVWLSILEEYYKQPKDMFSDIDELFIVEVTPIELPNTVEEMFK